MKRIASQVNSYCTYCKANGVEGVKAVWRLSYDFKNRSCDDHKPSLQAQEDANRKLDDHYSEADYQTWMKL